MMKNKRGISWMLVALMVIGMLSGMEEVMASTQVEDLSITNQEDLEIPLTTTNAAITFYELEKLPTEVEWQSRIFGNSTSLDNNFITINGDKSVTLESQKGKIAGDHDGIAFHYTPWDSSKGFQLTAKAHVESFAPNNQVAFGLMLRDLVGKNGDSNGHKSSFVAAGAVKQATQGFYRTSPTASFKENVFSPVMPTTGDEYTLRIIKGQDNDVAIVSVDGQQTEIDTRGMFTGDIFYLGLFTAREAKVTFSDIELLTNVSKVQVTEVPSKTEYLLGQELELEGLEVEASFDGGEATGLKRDDYAVSGYNKDQAGTQIIYVNYGGQVDSFTVTVKPLACTDIFVEYFPAKTKYYLGDELDLAGLVVRGVFNNGFLERELSPGNPENPGDLPEYIVTGFDKNKVGKQKITVISTENPDIFATFDVEVAGTSLKALEITKEPVKTIYFINDALDLDGLSVSAVYDDGTKVRLDKSEYEYTDLDTAEEGAKSITITHKDKTVELPLIVKLKELVGVEITKYPTTTFVVGEAFHLTGLKVSKVYDNGDKEFLESDLYTINSDAFKSVEPGTYEIEIVPKDEGLNPIKYEVTVREKVEYSWDFITFGQSISKSKNYFEDKEDGTIRIVAEEGAGKVTGDHDGISFYYTEIDAQKDNFELSADIKVNKYAKAPHDGQESFGIMARDAIGTNGDSGVFASNIAAIGGFSGGTGDANGTQLFVRTGVESSDGAGSKGIQKVMLSKSKPETKNTHPATDYKLTLAKTNSGYTGKINNGVEELIYQPEILKVQDSNKIYVGFYAARLADIEVSNIELKVTQAASDAP